MKIGLQLYSIKEEAMENFEDALKITAEAGYDAVEFAGYFGNSPKDMKALLEKYNLTAVSSHVGINRFINDFDEEMEYALELGYNMIVCPYLNCESLDELLKDAKILETCAKKASAKGLVVGYHNHKHEFEKFEGKYAMDILMEQAPSIKFQPDLFWVAAAGVDPVSYIKPYVDAGRVCAIHAKEIAKEGTDNVYVGEGRIDFATVASMVDPEKIPFIVEQEEYTTDHFDGISKSFNGLSQILKK